MKVGLVLGGGGLVGLAAHAGALTALEADLGWDARTADVIVGTSAGAITGVMLRQGASPSELATTVVAPAGIPDFSWRSFARFPHLPSRTIIANWMRRPWRLDPVAALVSMLADGRVDLATLAEEEAAAVGDVWPADDLWICAVRQHDLRRVVFGRDARPPLASAVLSSCSIPSFFRPVTIDGDMYLDGGVRSPTNAEVLARRDLDLVVILSPMSGRELPRMGVGPAIRRYAKHKVDTEVAALRKAGVPAIVIEPDAELCELMGTNPMCSDHLVEIVGAAFLDTGSQVRAPFVRTLLGGLNRRDLGRAS
jgi:NTE family protein